MCQVAWATPAQSRATGNRWVIEELTAKEQAARERGAALDREIDEYSRQIAELKEAKAQATTAALATFGTDNAERTEYPAAAV